VLGITTEDEQKAQSFVISMGNKMDYTVVVDGEESLYGEYMGKHNVSGIPHAFLVGQGSLQWKGHPMEPAMVSNIEKCLEAFTVASKPKIDFKHLSREELLAMPIKTLKQILEENRVNIQHILEKSELVDAIEKLQQFYLHNNKYRKYYYITIHAPVFPVNLSYSSSSLR